MQISVSALPVAQSIVGGSSQVEVADYILDTTDMDTDVRISSIPLELIGSVPTMLTSCTLYDGDIAITTGSNVVNPVSAGSIMFTFDAMLVIPRGTVKTVRLATDISSPVDNSSFSWGLAESPGWDGVSDVETGQTIYPKIIPAHGQTMTVVSKGQLFAAISRYSPPYQTKPAGSVGVELMRVRIVAVNENVGLKRFSLELEGPPFDLTGQSVTLWTSDGVQIAAICFASAGSPSWSSIIASGYYRIAKGAARDIIVRGDISPDAESGDVIRLKYNGDAIGLAGGTYGVGVSSGMVISPRGTSFESSGIEIE